MLAQCTICKDALGDTTLLADVVKHKQTFYPSAWARYDAARPGTLRLVPTEERKEMLERDYKNMGIMIFSEPPAFGKILEILEALEKEINHSAKNILSSGEHKKETTKVDG